MNIRKLFNSFKTDYLVWLSGFLLTFIPLYPKLPLADLLPGYIVRLRLEDIFILVVVLIWTSVNWREFRNLLKTPLVRWVVVFLLIGLASVVSSLFISRTILLRPEYILKTILHFLRRVEYLSMFIVFVTSVKSRRQLRAMVVLLLVVVTLVVAYGYGQKYLSWPAYSTMNREFSKGTPLVLGEHGRVMSTFGGHYDLAAFLMMTLLIILALIHAVKKTSVSLGLILLFVASYWLLILTASRTSFVAYLVAVTFMYGVYWLYLKKSFFWSFLRYFTVIFFSLAVMLLFGDLADRFNQVVPINDYANAVLSSSAQQFKATPLYAYLFSRTESSGSKLAAKSDVPPQARPTPTPTPNLPPDVTNALTESGVTVPSTISAQLATGSAVLADLPNELKPRNYSDTALEKGLSAGIRYDALWPRAIAGFKTNPLFGSGYATLTREHWWEFTDAESTDNDYLRMLGETGLLGLTSFLVLIGLAIKVALLAAKKELDPVLSSFSLAVSALLIGLLTNAWYIDVFEASKVAYTLWMLVGMMVVIYLLNQDRLKN